MLALSYMVDLLQAASQGHHVQPDHLTEAANACLQKMLEAKWGSYMIKKFHWLLHFGDRLKHHKKLIGCFCVERKHKQIRRFATAISNSRSFETSVYREVLNQELRNFKQEENFQLGVGLVSPSKAPKKMKVILKKLLQVADEDLECWTANTARLLSGGSCSRGDVCLVKPAQSSQPWDACQIWHHIRIHGEHWTLGAMWQLQSVDKSSNSALWVEQDVPMFLHTADIFTAVLYSRAHDGVRTLIPYPWRQK